MSDNGWKIKEIKADLMPPSDAAGKWWPLYREIVLRLEQTSERFALEIKLEDGGAASARNAISRYANKRLGKGAIDLVYVPDGNGGGTLYARRGPNYPKSK